MIGCIQFRNTAHGFVHIEEMEKDGSRREIPGQTLITTTDAPNYTFDFIGPIFRNPDDPADTLLNPAFCAIKTRNTDGGNRFVSIDLILRKDKTYRRLIHRGPTPFEVADAPNFDFVMGKITGDLIGIKRRNTASGNVEVHVVTRSSGYRSFGLHAKTPIALADAPNFVFGVADNDRVTAIKRANSGTGTIEVHVLNGAATRWDFQHRTGFSLAAAAGRAWLIDPTAFALMGVTSDPRPGFVEIQRSTSTPVSGFPAPLSRWTTDLPSTAIGDFTFKMNGMA